ncbi:uncharacterized protein EDB91DRAFT_1239323 [Suillus paluster]|uniref:uncharacterized protein n=1 Tax=Suillus paluster TaxID=48578 RepID=UPI001B862C8E|nr:uncharacterized protein EDB91DRAFT_1239323 [Suillus paluster]KAG1728757.1 hypothetical protein EDB91DRAFT_1239323 [Suillus paluster]
MSENILLVHGDILTKEQLDAIIKSQCIEDTPKHHFQHVVFVPGLFHFKMACADALWHTWIQPQAGRTDVNSLWQHVGILRLGESGKFADSTWDSLKVFAKCLPSWELIVEMSECIINKYVTNTTALMHLCQQPTQGHDQQLENQVLCNHDELLYVDLCHAMNSATKKHKYAYHTAHFMVQMWYVYPEDLQRLIRLNWLCNPTGKAFKFRPVDWLVEWNNLYTKVIFAGTSPLIKLYRECHITIENGFHLKNCTMKHVPPDMTRTL